MITEKLKGIEKWKLLTLAPLLIGLARVIHFSYTGYFLPDEAVYLSCVINFFNDGNLIFYSVRTLFQYGILILSVLFNLDTPEKFVPFFVMTASIIACLTLFLSVKIVEKKTPEFSEIWLVPLLFLLSPAFCVFSALILTEILGVFFSVLTIFVLLYRKNIFHILLLGLSSGLCYHLREPLLLVSIYIILYFLRYKQFKNCLAFLSTSLLFFGGPPFRWLAIKVVGIVEAVTEVNITVPTRLPILEVPILPNIASKVVEEIFNASVRTGDVRRLNVAELNFTTHESLPLFNSISITGSDVGVMLIFSIGIFTAILILYGLYKRRVNYLVLTSFMIMVISSMYINLAYFDRYITYPVMFSNKMGTVIRFGVVSVFCIPLIPSLISGWSKKRIRYYALLAIVCMLMMVFPFTTIIQSNLSVGHVNRLDIFNYRSPWLILRDALEARNESNVMVVCDPISKVRFYYLEGVSYMTIPKPDLEEEFMQVLSQFQHVYLYTEKYPLQSDLLKSNVRWYWDYTQTVNYEVIHEDVEMCLYKVINKCFEN